MYAGMYVESFLMFCTAAESMLYWWTGHISSLLGQFEDYELFSKRKHSKCDNCIYLPADSKKQDEGQFPSVFQHINYLKESCGINASQMKLLKKHISTARNNQLRNDIVHGRINDVSLSILKQTEAAIIQMQDVFVEIEKEIKEK